MPRAELQLTFTDGSKQSINPKRPALMMAFEAAHGRSISDNMPTTDMMWMAYRAIKGFNPKGDKDLTEWAEGIEDIDLVTDEATNGALAPEGKAELAQQSS